MARVFLNKNIIANLYFFLPLDSPNKKHKLVKNVVELEIPLRNIFSQKSTIFIIIRWRIGSTACFVCMVHPHKWKFALSVLFCKKSPSHVNKAKILWYVVEKATEKYVAFSEKNSNCTTIFTLKAF